MKITAISPAVKTAGRYNIFVDGQYSFSLDETQVIELGVRKDEELDETRLKFLKNESSFGKHYIRALELIMRRPRSKWEMAQYVRRKEWEPDEGQRIIELLEQKGYLDDEAFARFWVRQRLIGAKRSRKRIERELSEKRVASAVIAAVADEFPDDHDAAALRILLVKKRHSYDTVDKLIRYAIGKGYRYDMIKETLVALDQGDEDGVS